MRRQTTYAKPGTMSKHWKIVDAQETPLGRLAAGVATILQGKHKPDWTPHIDSGDAVIVINAEKVGLTGNKAEQMLKTRWSGYPGGLKAETYGQVRSRKPELLVSDAVRRMLPKSRLGRVMLSNLHIYRGTEHPHAQQKPVELKV
jgi:large subunit ribosomal protein L13